MDAQNYSGEPSALGERIFDAYVRRFAFAAFEFERLANISPAIFECLVKAIAEKGSAQAVAIFRGRGVR